MWNDTGPGARSTHGNMTGWGNKGRRHKEGNTETVNGDKTSREKEREMTWGEHAHDRWGRYWMKHMEGNIGIEKREETQ